MPTGEVTWIETFTGKRVNPMHLDPELLDIVDIAHSLSQQCRFLGHCLTFYSIAEHSILVAELVERTISRDIYDNEEIAKTCLAALLHDAAEAYIGDIARPIKHDNMFKQVPEVERQILGKIMLKYNCTGADWALIKRADNIMLATEAEHLMADSGKGWYLPEPALSGGMRSLQFVGDTEVTFMLRFEEYGGKC